MRQEGFELTGEIAENAERRQSNGKGDKFNHELHEFPRIYANKEKGIEG